MLEVKAGMKANCENVIFDKSNVNANDLICNYLFSEKNNNWG